jgi:predicted RNA-binding Zn-ribbon protein involved in translation (DUF1610 family)
MAFTKFAQDVVHAKETAGRYQGQLVRRARAVFFTSIAGSRAHYTLQGVARATALGGNVIPFKRKPLRKRAEKFPCPHCGRRIRNQKLHDMHLHKKIYEANKNEAQT